eukprot:TRINITY_DN2630_c0_g1_i1.p1 TRINITY_DN2630_c0_g1~~TRINITY_DN2630_c0_g1_i1.p1  ORF type:complete len:1501 (-),score=313.67 TRINITY_DN2630_c0_g1_i1:14-4516(-)
MNQNPYSEHVDGMDFQKSSKLPPNDAGGFSVAENEDDFASFQPSKKRAKFSDDSGIAGPFFQAAGLERDSWHFEDDQDAFNPHFEHVTVGFSAASSSSASKPEFAGFVTGNMRPVQVSEITRRRVAALGLELDDDFDAAPAPVAFSPPQPEASEGFAGFKTARNKEITVSEGTKQRLAALGFEFEADDLDSISHDEVHANGRSDQSDRGNQFASAFSSAKKPIAADAEPFVGFQTGRMNPIRISEETKRKVAALGLEMDDDDEDDFGDGVIRPAAEEISDKRLGGFVSGAKGGFSHPNVGFGTTTLQADDDDNDDDAEAAFEQLLAKRRAGVAPKPLQVRKKDDAAPLEVPQRPVKPVKSVAPQKPPSSSASKVPPQMRPFKKPAQGAKLASVGDEDNVDIDDSDDIMGALDMLAEETLAFQPTSDSKQVSSSPPASAPTNRSADGLAPQRSDSQKSASPSPANASRMDIIEDMLAGISADDFDFQLDQSDVDTTMMSSTPQNLPPPPQTAPEVSVSPNNRSMMGSPSPNSAPAKIGSHFVSRTPKPKSGGSGANTPNLRRHDTSPRGLVDTTLRSPPVVISSTTAAAALAAEKTPITKTPVPGGGKKIGGLQTPRTPGLSKIAQKLDFPAALPEKVAPAPLAAPREKEAEPPRKKRERQVSYSTKSAGDGSGGSKSSAPEVHLFDLEPKMQRLSLRDFGREKNRVPARYTDSELQAYRLIPEAIHMTSDSAYHFVFKLLDEETNTLRTIGPMELRKALIASGADGSEKFASVAWVRNHYRWIVWKLASMERSFPQDFGCSLLTPQRVLSQLKYRYEREFNRAHRSALKKILEQDEAAARHIVLAVAAVRWIRGAPHSVPPDLEGVYGEDDFGVLQQASVDGAIVEVTDGWYCVHAVLDDYLTELLDQGKLSIGMKIHVALAEVIGAEQAQSPLEMTPSSAMLKLRVNAVKRAAWHAQLGVQKSRVFKSAIRSVRLNGGPVPLLEVFVQRAYPILFSESYGQKGDPSSTRTVRNSRGEHKAFERHDKRLEVFVEQVRARVAAEIEAERETRKRLCRAKHRGNARALEKQIEKQNDSSDDHDGESLYDMMLASGDEEEFARSLPPTWRRELEKFIQQQNLDEEDRMQKEIKNAIEETASMNRETMPMLRLLVVDNLDHDPSKPDLVSMAVLTIWRPTRELASGIREGMRLKILGAQSQYKPGVPTPAAELTALRLNRRQQGIPVSLSCAAEKIFIADAAKSSRNAPPVAASKPKAFVPRFATPLHELPRVRGAPIGNADKLLLPYDEFDGGGVILEISESKMSTSMSGASVESFTVYIGDQYGNMAAILLEMHPDSLPSRLAFRKGLIIAFQNVKLRLYDETMQLFMCEANELAEFYFQQPTSLSLAHLSQLYTEMASAFRESDDVMDYMYAQLYSVISRGYDTEKAQVPLADAEAVAEVAVSQIQAEIEEQRLSGMSALPEYEMSEPSQQEAPVVLSPVAPNRSMVNKSVKNTPMLSNPM